MKRLGGAIVVSAIGICAMLLAPSNAASGGQNKGAAPRLVTDGRLRAGHLERMSVRGFPGRGIVEISFFPTAICEGECGARIFWGGRTDVAGAATFTVSIPNTFFDKRDHPVYFRDGERIEVHASWTGAHHAFSGASAHPQPILVRDPKRG